MAYAAIGIAAVAIRVWVYRSNLGIPNSDDAVVGLMARHIVDGQFTTFIWGQAYGGPQEALLAVPGFAIAGSSWFALLLGPQLLFLVGTVLVWRVGLRTLEGCGASVATALYWVWPPYVLYGLTHETSFYGFDIVYSALLLLLALRVVERPDRIRVGLLGFVAGLAFWETTQIVPILVAVVAWTVWSRPSVLRQAFTAVALAALGALPWIVWNLTHGWGSLSLPSGGDTSYAHRLRLFFSPVLPMMLGLRTPFSQAPLFDAPVVDLVYAVLFGLFAYGAFRSRGRPVSLLYVVGALYPFLYALAGQTFNSTQPRYLFVLSPVLVLVAAQAMTTWLRASLLIAVACAVTVVTLHRMEPVPTDLPQAPRNLAPLVATLDANHLDRIYAPYWLAYVLDFDTRERIVAVENKFGSIGFERPDGAVPPDPFVRYADYQREVGAARHGYVFFRRGLGAIAIVPALERHGFRKVVVGPFAVFVPPGPGSLKALRA
ncbi:MAG TPA: glycosyltransferase family 39 protein [Gaiellaceae bacterium]|nr:glycosyltransferase family 39 protein [Gaiellaceae bacterium]